MNATDEKNTNEQVSIIVPTYNSHDYLRQCLDSISDQTYQNWECIIVDDASTDDTVAIINSYIESDNRFKLLQQDENKGPAAARNRGISASNGFYLSFLDADDFIEPTLFEKAVNSLNGNGAEVVIWNVCFYNNNYNVVEYPDDPLIKLYRYSKFVDDKGYFTYSDNPDDIFNSFQNWAWNKMYRREFIIENDIYFPEQYNRTEDLAFTGKALLLAKKINILDDRVLTYYRIANCESAMNTKDKFPFDFLHAFVDFRTWLIDNELYESVRKSFVNWAIDSAFYNLNTLSELDNFKQVYSVLKEKGFTELGAFELEEQDFTPPFNYEQLQMVVEGDYDNFLFKKTQILDGLQANANVLLGIERDKNKTCELLLEEKEEVISHKTTELSEMNEKYNNICSENMWITTELDSARETITEYENALMRKGHRSVEKIYKILGRESFK